jgi:uncharacterized protein (TIGR02118 family)
MTVAYFLHVDGPAGQHEKLQVWADEVFGPAPLSFVVRYYPPIEKERAFNAHYFDHHPPIMAKFPRIRNILCYVPIDWQDANQVTPSRSFLGNEIVFDSIEDLNAALASEVRHDLRADYRLFPPHEGENSHHAMHRRAIRC